MIPVENDFPFEPTRQVETLEEDVTGIMATLTGVALARIVIAVARIVIRGMVGRCAPELDPVHLELAGILIAIPWITPTRIVAAGHGVPLSESQCGERF